MRPSVTTLTSVPVALEIEPEELAEAWFVLDDQDPGARDHGRILVRSRSRKREGP